MEPIKEAFSKVKKDMEFLKNEISYLKQSLYETQQSLIELCEIFKQFSNKKQENTELSLKPVSTDNLSNSTVSTHPSTHQTHFNALKHQNLNISTGNQGVPTDRQTDRQTDKQAEESSYNQENKLKNTSSNSIDSAIKILDSLDNIKKEIRLKFKRLTEQEMKVFSALYQLCEEEGYSDYKGISKKLNLTESSIRDYIGRIIKKGIPVEKKRINNKYIQIIISQNLKKIASLNTILQLREL